MQFRELIEETKRLFENDQNPIPEKTRYVKDEIMYWSARKELGIPPIGFSIPTWKPSNEVIDTERVLEKARQEMNPDAPSRLNCIFLCPEKEGWCDDSPYKNVFKVSATGKIFLADFNDYSFVRDVVEGRRGDFDPQQAAESYWLGYNVYFKEILLEGNATVIEQVS